MAQKTFYKRFSTLSILIAGAVVTSGLCGLLPQKAQALEYTDSSLMMKDYDQMEEILDKVKKQDTGLDDFEDSQHQKNRDRLFIILSRRDHDGTRATLIRGLQSDLDDDFYPTLKAIGESAIQFAKDPKVATAERSTYMMVLENIISEFRPQAKDKLKVLFAEIRDADIQVPDDVAHYRRLKMMETTTSPSKFAKAALERT